MTTHPLPTAMELLEFEVGHDLATRKSVAHAYAAAISSEPGMLFWSSIKEKIIDRWSKSGLFYIKKLAWDHIYAERHA